MENWLNKRSREQAIFWWKLGAQDIGRGLLNIWRGFVRCLPYWWRLHRLLEPMSYREETREAAQ